MTNDPVDIDTHRYMAEIAAAEARIDAIYERTQELLAGEEYGPLVPVNLSEAMA